MQTSKKKPSLIFLAFGALLAAYLGYLVGGAWEKGIDLMSFMERFNSVCAAPFANNCPVCLKARQVYFLAYGYS